MSVEPGFGGQKFIPEVLEKTKKIKDLIDKKNLNVELEIDGGINFENCTLAKKAGANVLVSGSTIFKENHGDLKKNINILRTNK
jgi:ribulose-phosphate 3-epimerase